MNVRFSTSADHVHANSCRQILDGTLIWAKDQALVRNKYLRCETSTARLVAGTASYARCFWNVQERESDNIMLPVRVATNTSLLRICGDLTQWESLGRLVHKDLANKIIMTYLSKNSTCTLTSRAISARDVSKTGFGGVTERHEVVKTMGRKKAFCDSVFPEARRGIGQLRVARAYIYYYCTANRS